MRVSVVATGIDQALLSQLQPVAVQPRAEAPRMRAPASAAHRAAPQLPVEVPLAPVINDVEIQPFAPAPIAFPEPITTRAEIEEEELLHFIPPAAEPSIVRPLRMPQIEDLPQVVQQQLRAREAAVAAATPAPETRRRSLLEKLAAFGITRREDEKPMQQTVPTPTAPLQVAQAAPPPQQPQLAPAPAPTPLRGYPAQHAQAEFGRPQPRQPAVRSAAGQLDPHGRAAPRAPVAEDDHLDIPAFLRRQPN